MHSEDLYIIKIGGNIIDNDAELEKFITSFAAVEKPFRLLVHGGGKLATQLAGQLNVPQQMIEGRRVTDAETLKIVTMVYAGYINKNLVARLQSKGINAFGMCGADGQLILAEKRATKLFDFGFAGDIITIDAPQFNHFLFMEQVPVVAPIAADDKGQLLNINADTIAQSVAVAMSTIYNVILVYGFEKPGVLSDVNDASSVISQINSASYAQLREEGKIFAGMIPKLDNAFAALRNGVTKVIIGNATSLPELINGTSGTTIVL